MEGQIRGGLVLPMTVLQLFSASAEARVFRQKLKRRYDFCCKSRLVAAKILLYALGKFGEGGDSLIKKITVAAAQIAQRGRVAIAYVPQFRTVPGTEL